MILRLILASSAICLLQFPVLAQPAEPVVTRMGNGLTVIVQEDHAAELVGIDVWVKAGSGSETPDTNGVSHMIEHLAFAATSKRQPGQVDREMESLGATLDAHTSYDWAHYNTTISSRYLAKALDVLADVVSGPQFRDVDIEREKPVIMDEIARKQTDPMAVCRDLLRKEVYGDHPYSLTIEGTAESIKKITRQNLLEHHNRYYAAGNMAIVLVGDLDVQRAVEEVGKAFQRLPNKPAPNTESKAITPPESQVNKSIREPFKMDYLAIGFLGPKAADETDICAMDVLLTNFGFGYRSWLADELKGKMGLAIDVDSEFLTQRDPGMVSIVAGVASQNVDKAKGAIFAQLAKLRSDGISPGELALAKRSLLGQYAFQNETYGGRANSRGFYFAVSQPEFAAKYVSCVQSVTNEDVVRVAEKYLDPAHAVVLAVGANQGGSK